MRIRPALLLLTVLGGCATLGTPITGSNNHIRMPHYSVTVPANQGWYLGPPNPTVSPANEEVAIVKMDPPFSILISMIRQTVLSDRHRAMSAKEVADDYRSHELGGIVALGVLPGHERLENVVRGEAKIGDKQFYTMSFMRVFKSKVSTQVMYLYFPKPKGNTWFIHANYLVSKPANIAADATESVKTVFENVLKTLVVR